MSGLKKFVAVRIFKRRQAASATSEAPRSTATDLEPGWISSAQNVARLAATSDHLPSIQGVANVFTEILGQIQKLKKNKDDFHDITTEIADLLNFIMKYVKEHELTPQALLEVCEEFLRIMLSLQTKMRQSVWVSRKRFSSAQSYRDVLYPFHVQITSLRKNVEAIIIDMSSSPGFFAGAKSIAIGDSAFTEVHGNQIINYFKVRTGSDQTMFFFFKSSNRRLNPNEKSPGRNLLGSVEAGNSRME